MKLSTCIILLISHAAFPATPADTRQPYTLTTADFDQWDKMDWKERSWAPRIWPKEKVKAFLNYYKKYATSDGGRNWEAAADTLVFLGDEDAIERCAKGTPSLALFWSRNPKVIPKVVPTLLSDEVKQNPQGSIAIAEEGVICILTILDTTPEFSPTVHDWTHTALDSDFLRDPIGITLVRKWWNQNHLLFERGDYEHVTPGDPFPPDPPIPQRPKPDSSPAPEPATKAPSLPTASDASPNRNNAPAMSVAHSTNLPMWMLLGGAAAALAGLGAIIWRSRRNASK
jgi:hypothetical protein